MIIGREVVKRTASAKFYETGEDDSYLRYQCWLPQIMKRRLMLFKKMSDREESLAKLKISQKSILLSQLDRIIEPELCFQANVSQNGVLAQEVEIVEQYNDDYFSLRSGIRNILASVITILPAYLIVLYVPNAFIKVLGFAGMMLAVIAILLPVYIFCRIKTKKLYYSELNKKALIHLSSVVAVVVILCEIFNVFFQ